MMSTAAFELVKNTECALDTREQRDESQYPGYIGISEMAKRHDTTLRTLRFYEARGLLKPYRDGQNRLYDNTSEHRFKLIDEGRKLGFTLTEIAELIGSSLSIGELNLSLQRITDQIAHLEEQHRTVNMALGKLRRRYYVMSENAGTK